MDALESILKKIPFFKDINYPLQDLVKKMRLERFEENTDIFSEGEQGSSLYLIISGKVLIYAKSTTGQEMAIQTLEPSDFFGEMSLLDGGYRSACARTLEKSIIFSLERKDFLEFLDDNPRAAVKIIETLSKRLRQSNIRNKILIETNRKLTNQGTDQNQITAANIPVQFNDERQEQLTKETKEFSVKKDTYAPEEKEENGFADILEQHLNDVEHADEEDDKADAKKEIEQKEMLYYKKAVCPICNAKFETPKALSKYVQSVKMDYDFCQHHKYINPIYYEMSVCPICGFTYNEEIQGMRLKKEQSEEIKSRLMTFWQNNKLKDYSGVRSLEDAIETFLLAIYCLQGRAVKKSQMGMMYLKIAWFYRFKDEGEQERKYIERALASLSLAFEKEDFSAKAEINTAYLLGVLNLNTGNIRESAKWLDRVLRHPAKSMFPMIINQTRDLWTDVRQKLREEKERKE
ncbi:DUF2225 domain-containing protein [Pelotomaculum isophthalicicum JI]|uniref:DUF2225 domain-containing protein n=1 Tax=Pelotomaculum isophthalicicum JI TaxID=947010 RepID=A0A9X4H4M7_9FIRM|nr:DUF2225 domain-containing protein [Pelotomaculum isophthalicicum]MDF9406899.1 DUF2225 domain-containing protein [Pelotomaculum isophthalicicum JI]